MNVRIIIAGIATIAFASSAHAQDSIADVCAEFLAPSQWPEPMSRDERVALDAIERERFVSVKEMVDQLPSTLEVAVEDSVVPGASISSRSDEDGNDYRSIRDWRNPIVIIVPEGVEVRSSAFTNGSLRAPIGALRCILTNLPVTAWSHGRVIRAQDASIVGSLADLVPIRRNHSSAQAILDELQIEIVWIPA